jgi:hypothetical protein
VSPSPHLRTDTDPVSETLCFLVFRVPDDEQSPETLYFSTVLLFNRQQSQLGETSMAKMLPLHETEGFMYGGKKAPEGQYGGKRRHENGGSERNS